MLTNKSLFYYLLLIPVTIFSCSEPTEEINQIPGENHGAPGYVTKPLKASFYTIAGEDVAISTDCGPNISPLDFWNQDHQVGEGNATHLGKFSIEFKFCFHVKLTAQGFPDFAGGFGTFNQIATVLLVAANGDELYAEAVSDEGHLMPSNNPNYAFMFDNHLYFDGGTGRFEGASGEVKGVSYVGDGITDHNWEGTIILPTGK